MKLRIGSHIIDPAKGDEPFMVILSEQDKKNIADMPDQLTKYGCFPDKWGTKEEMTKWMTELDV